MNNNNSSSNNNKATREKKEFYLRTSSRHSLSLSLANKRLQKKIISSSSFFTSACCDELEDGGEISFNGKEIYLPVNDDDGEFDDDIVMGRPIQANGELIERHGSSRIEEDFLEMKEMSHSID